MQISDTTRATAVRIIKYGISGGIGAVLQVGTLYVWVSLLGLTDYYLAGAILGFVIAVICTYILQRHWTFADRDHATMRKQFPIYMGVALGNLALTTVLLPLAKLIFQYYNINFFHIWYLIVSAGIVLLGALLTFVVNSLWTFRKRV